jgi:hypothetical protein
MTKSLGLRGRERGVNGVGEFSVLVRFGIEGNGTAFLT